MGMKNFDKNKPGLRTRSEFDGTPTQAPARTRTAVDDGKKLEIGVFGHLVAGLVEFTQVLQPGVWIATMRN
jgi:hypothetical protein